MTSSDEATAEQKAVSACCPEMDALLKTLTTGEQKRRWRSANKEVTKYLKPSDLSAGEGKMGTDLSARNSVQPSPADQLRTKLHEFALLYPHSEKGRAKALDEMIAYLGSSKTWLFNNGKGMAKGKKGKRISYTEWLNLPSKR